MVMITTVDSDATYVAASLAKLDLIFERFLATIAAGQLCKQPPTATKPEASKQPSCVQRPTAPSKPTHSLADRREPTPYLADTRAAHNWLSPRTRKAQSEVYGNEELAQGPGC
ncbi:Hypothetical predicted protein [Pelobates cultripes]|uniref:Uncharacterized protein n=1 Tax=Pelobates cultripes TaxID=61616 RepID=A0AAD1W8D4_PELCU|nr:Hypothetical predicted protein [Pelobates cultripes]